MDNEQKQVVRDSRVVIFLTPDDADFLMDLARSLGFKGRSEMIAAILERLIIGGMSARVFLQLGIQFARRMSEFGPSTGRFYFGVRPLPALPVEDGPTLQEEAKALTEIRAAIKHEKQTA